MRFTRKAALVAAVAAAVVPTAALAHGVSVADPRGDAKGPFDLRSASLTENRATLSVEVTVKAYAPLPRRASAMPCIAFDYEPASGVHRVACPAASGARYELRETKGGKLVTRLAFTRPDAATIALVVPGRFLSGNGPIRWRAYFVGPGDTLLDTTRWGRHAFAD